jgi:hypothetical protein
VAAGGLHRLCGDPEAPLGDPLLYMPGHKQTLSQEKQLIQLLWRGKEE